MWQREPLLHRYSDALCTKIEFVAFNIVLILSLSTANIPSSQENERNMIQEYRNYRPMLKHITLIPL